MKSISFAALESLAFKQFVTKFNDVYNLPYGFWPCFNKLGGLKFTNFGFVDLYIFASYESPTKQ